MDRMNQTLLQILKVYGTMPLCDLARLIERDYGMVRMRIRRLRKNGYIEVVPDRENTRSIMLGLTPQGANFVKMGYTTHTQ